MEVVAREPLVACIIVHFRAPESVLRLVTSLKKARWPNKKILVVDNNSADGSLEWLRANISDIEIVPLAENGGYAAGVNAGIRSAQASGAEYFWLLTQDITVEPNCLEILTSLWSHLERPGFLGSLTDLNASDEIYFFRASIDKSGRVRHRLQGHSIARVPELRTEKYGQSDYVNGACLFTNASVLRKVGLMPEEYFLYYEDSEWGLRAQASGFKNYVSYVSRVHHHRLAGAPQWTAIYYGFRNAYLFKRRNGFAKPWTKWTELSRLRWKLLKSRVKATLQRNEDMSKQITVLSEVVRDLARESWGRKP